MPSTTMPPTSTPTLDEVLDGYALVGPSPRTLLEWAEIYPQYERQLRELTAAWPDLAGAPRTVSPSVRQRGQTLVAQALLSQHPSLGLTADEVSLDLEPQLVEGSPGAIDALLVGAGRTVSDVLAALGINRPTWARLRAGMFSAETSQSRDALDRLTAGLAYVLDRAADEVRRALPRQAFLPAGFAHADARPAPSQVDLAEALLGDAGLSDQTRRYYVSGEGAPPYAS